MRLNSPEAPYLCNLYLGTWYLVHYYLYLYVRSTYHMPCMPSSFPAPSLSSDRDNVTNCYLLWAAALVRRTSYTTSVYVCYYVIVGTT